MFSDKQMKVCQVITRLILGGAQENTILTCEGLKRRGHDVTLITGPPLGPEGQLMDRALAGGYRLIVVDSMRREISPLRDALAYRALLRQLRQLRPDVMHSHSSKAGILARKAAAKVGGIRIVHTVHGLPFHRYQSRWRNRLYVALEKRAARRTDAIVSVADAMTMQALAAGVGRPGQYATIYSGMEVEPFLNRAPAADEFRRSLKLPADAVLVTQVSRLFHLKGHEFIIAAAEKITDARVHFCFVGDGILRRQIEAEISRRGLAGRFHLTGLLPPEHMPAVMHASDIVVHCSLREGLARALPQAMLAGKPVVTFDVDGAPEVVDQQTGVLLRPRDVRGLKVAIEALAASPEIRARLGGTGRQRCREMFDHNRMVEQVEALYRRILQ
ncbi:MAG TPA: glycosyltransferase family 4 protein [Phycisphaerae bacterium]|nr:glycosyltransferase family 4 protein [Phycisphaerae bacterium]